MTADRSILVADLECAAARRDRLRHLHERLRHLHGRRHLDWLSATVAERRHRRLRHYVANRLAHLWNRLPDLRNRLTHLNRHRRTHHRTAQNQARLVHARLNRSGICTQ